MIVGRITNATRDLGKGYIGLPVRDVLIRCSVNGLVVAMETAWHPTSSEIARIVAGAPVVLRVLGDEHPPVSVDVGEVPCDYGVAHYLAEPRAHPGSDGRGDRQASPAHPCGGAAWSGFG